MDNKADSTLNKKIFITLSVIIVTSLHYFTTTEIHTLHDIYQRLYYIPIICAAVWFGVRGGLTASLVISLVYIGHIIYQWKLMPHVSLQKYLEIIIFNLVALVAGLLTEREQKLKKKYLLTADKLQESYDTLKQRSKEMIEIEEQLRRADKLTMLGQISAELAHEIRNPLGSILGTAEIIKKDYSKENKDHEFIEILLKETKRLNEVLNNFLNFTRSDSVTNSLADINMLVKDAVNFFFLQFKKNGIVTKLNLDEKLDEIMLEGELIKQVFFNIILNGIQAMPEGGTFTVITRTEEAGDAKFLVIDFSDTGKGIVNEDIDKLFKPFYTSKDKGTGLGLSISQKIVEKFDGEITVKSKVYEGTTFTIKLPYLIGNEDGK